MLLRYLITFTIIIALCQCSIVNMDSITSVDVNLITTRPADGSEVEYVCEGGMQLNMLNEDELLLGICSPLPSELKGVIGTLPIRCLLEERCDVTSSAVTVRYGDITGPAPATDAAGTDWDGTDFNAIIATPEHLYQTTNTIYFIDARSCARKINRNTGETTTVKGYCNNGTLDIPGITSEQVTGMTYFEDRRMWVVALLGYGIYVFSEDTEPRRLVANRVVSETVNDNVRQITRGFDSENRPNDIVWHKVSLGVNYYDLSEVNATSGYLTTYENLTYLATFVRYISANGDYIDSTARRADPSDPRLGQEGAALTVSPDGSVLLIADMDYNKLFFLDIVEEKRNGSIDPLQEVCEGDRSAVVNDPVLNCTFSAITAALWIYDDTILVYERSTHIDSGFRVVRLLLPSPEDLARKSSVSILPITPKVTTGLGNPESILPITPKVTTGIRKPFNNLSAEPTKDTVSAATMTKWPYYANISLLIISLIFSC